MLLLLISLLSKITFSRSIFQLDEKTFQQSVIKGDKSIPWFIMFGSENCPACIQAAPEFEHASERTRGYVRFGYADTKYTPNIASQLNIRAIPAFFLFTNNSTESFIGQRTSTGFLTFISDALSDGLEEADESWVDQTDNRVILFTKRFKAPVFFSAVHYAFRNKGITFGMTRDSETIEIFDNPPIPSIWFFKNGEKTQYKENLDYFSIIDAISKHFDIEFDDDLDL